MFQDDDQGLMRLEHFLVLFLSSEHSGVDMTAHLWTYNSCVMRNVLQRSFKGTILLVQEILFLIMPSLLAFLIYCFFLNRVLRVKTKVSGYAFL